MMKLASFCVAAVLAVSTAKADPLLLPATNDPITAAAAPSSPPAEAVAGSPSPEVNFAEPTGGAAPGDYLALSKPRMALEQPRPRLSIRKTGKIRHARNSRPRAAATIRVAELSPRRAPAVYYPYSVLAPRPARACDALICSQFVLIGVGF